MIDSNKQLIKFTAQRSAVVRGTQQNEEVFIIIIKTVYFFLENSNCGEHDAWSCINHN